MEKVMQGMLLLEESVPDDKFDVQSGFVKVISCLR